MNDEEIKELIKKLKKENMNKKLVLKSRIRKFNDLLLLLLAAGFLNFVIVFLLKANLWTILGSDCILISMFLEWKI